MITLAEVEKLGRVHTVEPIVLSVYLNVPRSPAELAGLPGRVDELVAAAVRNAGRSGHLREEDRRSARDEVALAGPDWLGHPVAVFVCAEVGLLEVVGLPEARPGTSPERAVLGIRPHIRPLLAALQPSPRLAAEILAEPAAALTAIGLPACLAAVNAGAVETLAVPQDGLVPGYECGRCGALGLAADCCPDWGTAALPVPDLIEEMVSRTLEDGGRVLVVHGVPGGIAARMPSLRWEGIRPFPARDKRSSQPGRPAVTRIGVREECLTCRLVDGSYLSWLAQTFTSMACSGTWVQPITTPCTAGRHAPM